MAQALAKVKRELGPDAVILNTRTFKRGGLMGLAGKTCVEVTASKDMPVDGPQRRHAPGKAAPPASVEHVQEKANLAAQLESLASGLNGRMGELQQAVQHLLMRGRWTSPAGINDAPEQLVDAYTRLIQAEVADEMALKIINTVRNSLSSQELTDADRVRKEVRSLLTRMLPTCRPLAARSKSRPYIIALVGPTGVGKTTTIAKLAANLRLRDNLSVGMLTLDTYRIAAVQQLQTYADIMGVDLRVIDSPRKLTTVSENMGDKDVVLIDTPGRSQKDDTKLTELGKLLKAAAPHEVHLVLPGNYSRAAIIDATKRFALLGVNRVIFTKLDETVGFGTILACLQQVNATLSYVTAGQSVPDDIAEADGSVLAGLIMQGRRGVDIRQLCSA